MPLWFVRPTRQGAAVSGTTGTPGSGAGFAGQTWQDAYALTDLDTIIAQAWPGDEIWVSNLEKYSWTPGNSQAQMVTISHGSSDPNLPIVIRGCNPYGHETKPAVITGDRADPYFPQQITFWLNQSANATDTSIVVNTLPVDASGAPLIKPGDTVVLDYNSSNYTAATAVIDYITPTFYPAAAQFVWTIYFTAAPVRTTGSSGANFNSSVVWPLHTVCIVNPVGVQAGPEGFRFATSAASNLMFGNLQLDRFGPLGAFRIGAPISGITFRNLRGRNSTRFIDTTPGTGQTDATITGSRFRDIQVVGCGKNVLRLQYGSNDLDIEDVYGDCNGQVWDDFFEGIQLGGAGNTSGYSTVHNVRVRRCHMKNGGDYTHGNFNFYNSDGFASEEMEYGLYFESCIAEGFADAGFDTKGRRTTYVDCIARGNKNNFKVWDTTTFIECQSLDTRYSGDDALGHCVELNGCQVIWYGGLIRDFRAGSMYTPANVPPVPSTIQGLTTNPPYGSSDNPTGSRDACLIRLANDTKKGSTDPAAPGGAKVNNGVSTPSYFHMVGGKIETGPGNRLVMSSTNSSSVLNHVDIVRGNPQS